MRMVQPLLLALLVGWIPPPSGFFKLNMDGSTLGNPGLAGAGGLLRHSDGFWFRGFTRNIGITSSFATELWGVSDGLRLAKQYNIQKLIIELDAKVVLDLLMSDNNTSLCYHPLSALISDCRSLIHSFEEARLLHTYREGNFCADLLVKEGTKTLNSG
jgi:ribonuclease HI